MAHCKRCGIEMNREDGYFCAGCKEFLIKHKVYKEAVKDVTGNLTEENKKGE